MNIHTTASDVWQERVRDHACPELAIVIPTYREVDNIVPVTRGIASALGDLPYEVIFVDDDSPDGTIQRIRQLAREDGRLRAIRRVGRRGLAGAVLEGMLSTSARYIAVMDCDLQHDERLLLRMLDALREGADLAIATRYLPGGNAGSGLDVTRERGSRFATWLSNMILKQPVSDPMSGFFMLHRSVCDELAPGLSTAGFKILLDILASNERALHIAELPYEFRPRSNGTSKLDARVVAEFVGLLIAKRMSNAVSPRFVMFALVGASGLIVHLAALKTLVAFALPFDSAQLAASYTAMLSNFILNNELTYGDRRLRGWAALRGFASFALVCSIGTLANVGVAKLIYAENTDWLLAGLAGAIMAAAFNYAMTAAITWRNA